MESDNECIPVDPIKELDYDCHELFQDPALQSQLKEHMLAMQEDFGYVDESQDLEALSDEDADDFSNREQQHYSNEFQNTHQSFYEEFHESQHEGQFECVQEDTAIFARDLGDSDFEKDPVQQIHVGLDQVFPSQVSAVDKTKLQDRAVDKRQKPDKSRKPSFLHPVKKNEKAKKVDESLHNTKVVDLLIIGGGPATLGFIMNALKTNRFPELIQNDGMAILDAGTSFGGGNLCNYGINSNTSANGFVKSILRKDKKENAFPDKLKAATHKVAALKPQSKFAAMKPKPKPRNLGTDKKAILVVDVDQPTHQLLSPKQRTPLSPKIMNAPVLNPQTEADYLNAQKHAPKKVTKPNPKTIAKKPEPYKSLAQIKQLIVNTTALIETKLEEETDTNVEKKNDYDEDIYCDAVDALELPPLTCCRELVNSSIVQVMRQFGKQIVPLSMVGHLLNYVGNYVLFGAYLINRSKIFYPMHRALNVQLMANGDIITTVQKTEFVIVSTPGDKQELSILQGRQSLVYFRSKALIMAGGASQGFHPQIFSWFPSLLQDQSRLISSDSFLKKWVFLETIRRLKGIQDQAGYMDGKPIKRLNIVIIGGSHSGFSCAWMLLNGPSLFQTNSIGISTANGKLPGALRKSFKNCQFCCGCIKDQPVDAPKDVSIGRSSKVPQKIREPDNASDKQQCFCICKCFGYFRYDDWGITRENLNLPIIEEAGIKILYRDNIKVFFKTGQDAINANYHDFDKERHRIKDGFVYSFTGLRGDAKNLYLRVKNGLENRIQFVKAKKPEQQNIYVQQADIVIWACGYQSDAIPIFDNGKPIKYSQTVPNTQFDVDNQCRIKLDDGSVLTKCYACGVGFPVRTKDGVAGIKGEPTNPRADSFSLYMNTVGEMLLKNVLPKRRNAGLTCQRQYPIVTPEPLLKLMHTAQKKKPKEMLAIQGANMFSQAAFQMPRAEDIKQKIMQTQKHITHKITSQHPVQSLHSSPKAVLKDRINLQMERKPVAASDSIGDGLRIDVKGSDVINDITTGGLAQQIEQEALPRSYASKSLERRVPQHDAIELLNEFKRKHLRGLTHNRFDQLTYSDLVKRKQPNRQHVQPPNRPVHGYGEVTQDGQTEEAFQASFQLPDIRGRENDMRQLHVGSANTTKRRHDAYANLIERNPSRKRQPALSGKSPQLIHKKNQELSRVNADKTRTGPKTRQFFGRSGKNLHFEISPYIQSSALDIHSQMQNSLHHKQTGKDVPVFDTSNLLSQEPDKKSRKETRHKIVGHEWSGSKSLQFKSRAIKKGTNNDIKNVVDQKHALADSDRNQMALKGNYDRNEIQIEEHAQTELPPIQLKSSQIPTIKNAIPNRKYITGSQSYVQGYTEPSQNQARKTTNFHENATKSIYELKSKAQDAEASANNSTDLTPTNVCLKKNSSRVAYLNSGFTVIDAAQSEENLKLPPDDTSQGNSIYSKKIKGLRGRDSKFTSVSHSQNFAQIKSLHDQDKDSDHQWKRGKSPQFNHGISTVGHDLTRITKKKADKLNKIYAPHELLTREEIAAMMIQKSPQRPKSITKEPKSVKNDKSETKARTIGDQDRPKDKIGLKSAGNLKSSLLFTPAKSSAPKAEAQPTEPKKSSIVGSVIAQLTVSQIGLNEKAQRKVL